MLAVTNCLVRPIIQNRNIIEGSQSQLQSPNIHAYFKELQLSLTNPSKTTKKQLYIEFPWTTTYLILRN